MMQGYRIVAAAALLLFCRAAWGAEGDGNQEDAAPAAENVQPSRRGGRFGGMRERMESFQRQLKEKFPSEYAEIEKLRETDRGAAMRKTMELAGKAGLEMPFHRGGHRRGENAEAKDAPESPSGEWRSFFARLKEKCPDEFQALEKKLAGDPQNVLKEIRALAEKNGIEIPKSELPSAPAPKMELNRNRNRILVARANRLLAQMVPEEYAELEKLRETDDDAAREKFRSMVRQAGITPAQLLSMPVEPVPAVSYSDKDIEAANPSANSAGAGWGGRWNRGGWGGNRGGRGRGGNF